MNEALKQEQKQKQDKPQPVAKFKLSELGPAYALTFERLSAVDQAYDTLQEAFKDYAKAHDALIEHVNTVFNPMMDRLSEVL